MSKMTLQESEITLERCWSIYTYNSYIHGSVIIMLVQIRGGARIFGRGGGGGRGVSRGNLYEDFMFRGGAFSKKGELKPPPLAPPLVQIQVISSISILTFLQTQI